MQLQKSQIEQVRYQLTKLGTKGTNEEIRVSADKFSEFDAVLIANDVVSSRTTELSTIPQNEELTPATESSNDNSMLSLLDVPTPSNNTLTTTQKHALIQIKSQELGIDLSVTEITKISDMVSEQINDSINFLSEVGILISEFFTNRNNQVQQIVNEKIEDITQIINTGNDELGDIFSSANKRLIDVATDCSRQKTDYKSTYQSKLESIREMLKLSA
jgi:hypothetical protein